MELKEAIKIKLNALNIRQEDLAKKLGVNQSQISNALNGRNQKILNLIYHYLVKEKDVQPNELLPDEESRMAQMEIRLKDIELQLSQILQLRSIDED